VISLADYTSYDGLGLAELVARRDVSPQELADAAFAAIERVNPQLNAVLQRLPDRAHAEIAAGLPQGPFTGLPFLIKELGIGAKNVSADLGSRLLRGLTAPADTELMARFRRAGLVLAGTTQTPEVGYNPTTETVLHGPVHNPWDPTRSAGGSSGGSGAAVAAGIVPIAHANDGGGSIRIPAACNGLVGLKPTRDRIPSGPGPSDSLAGLAIDFAVTRSVRDAAALLDAVAGPDVGAASHPVPPARPYRDEVGANPGKLRIAFSARPASGKRADPECERAVASAAKLLESAGHTLVEAAPPLDWDPFLDTVHVIWTTGTARLIDALTALLGRKPDPNLVEAVTWACYEDGKRFTATDLLGAMAHHSLISRQVGAFFTQFDALVTPTLSRPPAPLGELDQNERGLSAIGWTRQVFEYCPFTPLFNTTGQPAISLPLHWSEAGLPIGVQVVGRFGDETTLFRLASQLEAAQPWRGRRPGIHAGN
jgi:amidase